MSFLLRRESRGGWRVFSVQNLEVEPIQGGQRCGLRWRASEIRRDCGDSPRFRIPSRGGPACRAEIPLNT